MMMANPDEFETFTKQFEVEIDHAYATIAQRN